MANDVFANGREISCKKADGKSICCFPDVCFTPPQTPATPLGVPIPYPNTGFAKDTKKGSKNVKISKKEVMLKNKSYFKKSTGDEAGRAPKKGIITSKIKGKVYFTSWSPNVKYEGKNVVRHFDLTTHNHGSTPGNSPPWSYVDSMKDEKEKAKCATDRKKEQNACGYDDEKKEYTWSAEKCCQNEDCQKARKCMLVPYGGPSSPNCCDNKVAHHVIPKSAFINPPKKRPPNNVDGWSNYDENEAPCVCTEGNSFYDDIHGDLHTLYGVVAQNEKNNKGMWTRKRATETGAKSIKKAYPNSNCEQACLEAQLNEYHDKAKDCKSDKPIRGTHPMGSDRTQATKGRKFTRDEARKEMGISIPGKTNN